MKLQTQIPIHSKEPKINYTSKVLLVGSCFTENIGSKFDYYKFQNIQNPFGVIFNPVSIEKLVLRAIENKSFTEADIFQQHDIFKCFDAHSKLSSVTKNETLQNLNYALQKLREALFTATHIIFTFGTSWVYRDTESDKIVANCHKLPQKNFRKELLSIETISESTKNIVSNISAVNEKATFIISVSPVRHIKDGFQENTLSKAHLFAAIHQNTNQKTHYFPAFEILMDELRDYRFYAEDMLHPNKTAIAILWEKFSATWLAPETKEIQNKIASLQKSLAHKPINFQSEEHQEFLKDITSKMDIILKNI